MSPPAPSVLAAPRTQPGLPHLHLLPALNSALRPGVCPPLNPPPPRRLPVDSPPARSSRVLGVPKPLATTSFSLPNFWKGLLMSRGRHLVYRPNLPGNACAASPPLRLTWSAGESTVLAFMFLHQISHLSDHLSRMFSHNSPFHH